MENTSRKICKNCIHYNVCNMYDGPYISVHLDHTCKYFTDKQLVAFLPCKVGDELFLTDYPEYHHRLKRYEFINERVVMTIECFELQRCCKRFVDESFGTTVFTDKSQMQAKLKELNNETT